MFIDNGLKSCIFVEVDDLRITGRSRLFVSPTNKWLWNVLKLSIMIWKVQRRNQPER